MANCCDLVTASSQNLALEMANCECIPDRFDLDYFSQTKSHFGKPKEAVWFGYHNNIEPLIPFLDPLKQLGIQLKTITDIPVNLGDINLGFPNFADNPDYSTLNYELIQSDIVLNPPLNKFKSDNKTHHAWLLNLPVARCPQDLLRFMDPENRNMNTDPGEFDVRLSVEQFKNLINCHIERHKLTQTWFRAARVGQWITKKRKKEKKKKRNKHRQHKRVIRTQSATMGGLSFVSHSHKLIVFWSPKCACTSMCDWFCKLEGIPDEQIRTASTKFSKRDWLKANKYEYSYRQARLLIENYRYRSVQFTRNPYTRAASAFINKFYYRVSAEHKNEAALTRYELLEVQAQCFIRLLNESKKLELWHYNGISFVEFLNFVQQQLRLSKALDHHWDTQLPRSMKFKLHPNFLVRQENFANDLEKLNSYLNIDNYLPQVLNKTVYPMEFGSSDSDLSGSNMLDLLSRKIAINKANLLNEKIQKTDPRNIFVRFYVFRLQIIFASCFESVSLVGHQTWDSTTSSYVEGGMKALLAAGLATE